MLNAVSHLSVEHITFGNAQNSEREIRESYSNDLGKNLKLRQREREYYCIPEI